MEQLHTTVPVVGKISSNILQIIWASVPKLLNIVGSRVISIPLKRQLQRKLSAFLVR